MESQLTLCPDKAKKYGVYAGAGLAGAGLVAMTQPAQAQTTDPNITAVSDTVSSLGGIVTVVVGIVLGAMGVRMAIKLVNRVAVQG